MNKRLNGIIWILATILVITAAYTFYSKNKSKGFIDPSSQNSATGGSSQSEPLFAPDFALKDLNGNTVKLSDYKGKIIVLNFWAVWCKYCVQEMPDLNELNKELQKEGDAVIITVDVQEPPETVRKFISSNKYDLLVLLDEDGSVANTYGISGLPNTFVLNSDLSLNTYIPGATNKETLKKLIEKAQ